MPEASTTRTDTTRYPVYATKGAFLADLKKVINQEACNRDRLIEILYRVSNTDTTNWEGGNGHAARGEP